MRDSALDRDSALKVVRNSLEEPAWLLMAEMELLLKDLAKATHFDLTDPTAVGAALHGALPHAFLAADISRFGLSLEHCKNGPCYKITGEFLLDEAVRHLSIELHHAGPQGGTSKTRHQFASSDVEGAPQFPGFETEAPESLLFFLAYHLDGAGTAISRLFLTFADGVDRKKIRVHKADGFEERIDEVPESGVGPEGAKLKIKEKAGGKAAEYVNQTTKRRDDSSSS